MQSLIYLTTLILASLIAASEVGAEPTEECQCRNILKLHDYVFEYFFPITKRDDDRIQLKFKVKADRDVNIIFTTDRSANWGVPAYEIVLGGWNNTQSVIRNTIKGPQTVITKGKTALVSPVEWREFWIEIKPDTIEVGRKGKGAFMVLEDTNELPIKYYSVAGWNNATVLLSLPCIEEKDFP